MDLIKNLNSGAALVEKDAQKLMTGEPLSEEYLPGAVQAAVDLVLKKNADKPSGFVAGAEALKLAAEAKPANV
jgi:hypothetical protein